MKKEWFVGIDVSKKWLDVAIFVENSDLKGFIHTQVDNDKQGYREPAQMAQGARCGCFHMHVWDGAHRFLLRWPTAFP